LDISVFDWVRLKDLNTSTLCCAYRVEELLVANDTSPSSKETDSTSHSNAGKLHATSLARIFNYIARTVQNGTKDLHANNNQQILRLLEAVYFALRVPNHCFEDTSSP
jgi:hypothetical protein